MPNFVVCLTTVSSKKIAEKIARELVKKKVVACVNVIPVAISFYHWKNKLCRDSELLLLMKTVQSKVRGLEKELHKIHPYDLPEFVVLPIKGGSKRYLEWVISSVR